MTDDPYPRLPPVVNAITGFFLSCLTLAIPLLLVTDRVKSVQEPTSPTHYSGENGVEAVETK